MDEHRTTAAGDTRAGIVVDFDDQIVEPVGALKPVAWFIGRPPEWLVVAAILGIFAPGMVGRDRPDRQQGAWARQAVRPPPQPKGMKFPSRRGPITFSFRGLNAGPAQGSEHRALSCQEPSLRTTLRADTNVNCG